MGWIFSLALFVVGCIKVNAGMLVAAGLFAIAGSIGLGSSCIVAALKNNNDNTNT